MFRRFLKEGPPALQLYGKLPLARDYLRVGASKGAGRDLREWLDSAFSSMADRGGAPRFPWPLRMVVAGAEGDPLLGSGWASSDRGGERSFPFVLFVERRSRTLIDAVPEELNGLEDLWRQLEELYAQRDQYADGEAFLGGMRGRELEQGGPALRGEVLRVSYPSWVEALWPEEAGEGLVRTLISLGRLLREGHRGPLRLPLVSDLPPAPQVSGWWSVLSELGAWPQGEVPSLFYPQRAQATGDEPAYVVFLRGRLRVEEAAWTSSARGQANLGRGDYTRGAPCLAGEAPVGENVPPLAVSMRGALATARARL